MRNVTPCPNWRELLSAYQDQNLSPKDRKRVAAHLESCGDCRQALAQMDGDRDRFIETYMAPAEKANMSESVLGALRADAATPAQQPQRKFPWGWVFRIGNAVAVVTLILVVAAFMSRDPLTEEERKAWEVERQANTLEEGPDASDRLASGDDTETRAYNPRIIYRAASQKNATREKDTTAFSVPAEGIYRSTRVPDGYIAWEARNGLTVPTFTVSSPDSGMNENFASNYQANMGDSDRNSYAMAGRLNRLDSALKIAYDIDYRVQVKNALQKSRQAQGIITGLGGFTMNYQYVRDEHEPAVACFNGKIPADKAEAALAQIEKLGNVRGLTIAGEDLTEQFQANRQEIARQTEHAKKLDAIGSRSASKVAAGVEGQRNDAKGQVDAAKQALTGLTTRHELVTITAAFFEAQPREPLTLARATAGTRHALNYALLLLVTIAVFFLLVALVAAPFVGLRYWRRRRSGAA